jgi:hypothetical protein
MDREALTPSLSHSSLMTLEANWGPWSEMTCCGRPVLCQTMLRYNLEVSSAVMSFRHGETMVALLKQSTTTNIESYPFEECRSVTKSIVIDFHIPRGTWFGYSGIQVRGWIFVDWQVAHPSMYRWMNWDIPGHQNSLDRSS